MSASAGLQHDPVPHGEPHGEEAGHGSLRGYLIGFGLSVVLTAIPFWLVMAHVIPGHAAAGVAVMVFAAVQMVVHMIFFLHLNTKSESGWNMLALIFTLVLLGITIGGSMWVMFHLNANMMPMSVNAMRDMP